MPRNQQDLIVWALALIRQDLDVLAVGVSVLNRKQERLMATIDDLVADEAALRTELGTLIALVQQLQAGQGLTTEQQAAVDALDASLKQDTADVQAAEQPPA